MEVLIVGAGAVGRWFAGTLVAGADESVDLAFADADPTAAEAAADALGGRAVPLDAAERDPTSGDAGWFDVVVVAVPISAVEEAIAAHAPEARDALVDLSGVMRGPVAAMREHAPDRERLSLHPLFDPEHAPGRIAAVVDAGGPASDAVRAALEAADNTVVETAPEEHDEAMKTVQARAHAAVLAFALAAEDVPEGLHTPVSEALFEVAERVTGGNPGVYAEIQEAFAGAEDVATAARRLAAADREAFERLYRDAS